MERREVEDEGKERGRRGEKGESVEKNTFIKEVTGREGKRLNNFLKTNSMPDA